MIILFSRSLVLGCYFLTISRYALDKGATSIAVDIQDTADHGESRSSKSAIKIIQHHEQQRVGGGLSKEDAIGSV